MRRGTYLVTGAAGTIGSVICRELIVSKKAGRLVMVDLAETPLFYLMQELAPIAEVHGTLLRPIAGSVNDLPAMEGAVRTYAPQAVIHAAAMKHVGICDQNIERAILVNVFGTMLMAAVASMGGAAFVMISTDKAVAPTTVMGQTKRVAELSALLYHHARVVRLVNVRGSQGSLLPLVRRQIEAGGPVSLTHLDMRRFFMGAEEAARLAIAATGYEAGRIYVPLGLGPPVRIADLIHDLIEANAAVTGTHVPVVVIGRRPGEKLVEQVTGVGEVGEAADDLDAVMIRPPWQVSASWQARRDALTEEYNPDALREVLADLANWSPVDA